MEEKVEQRKNDYFYATIPEGSLVMEPHCACDNLLDEKYFCEKCNKQCLCKDVLCDNETTLEYVNNLIKNSEMFKGFTAVLAPRK